MTAPARRSTARIGYDGFEADDRFAYGELLPGERNGPPIARRGSRAALRGFFLLIVFGGGWALLDDRAALPGWLSAHIADLSAVLDRRGPAQVERASSAVVIPAPPARFERIPPVERPSAQEPPASSRPDDPGATIVMAPPLASAAVPYAAVEQPDAPPTADPADPYQMRAAAVGLHPDLSRVLLARLSPADYRNAEIAIQTAVAETPDDGVLVWPRQRKPELALFQVRFVAGAAPGCRRYVVTVTKDGWLTTALPMEKCGPKSDAPGRG
jgi:hypothetical protein